MNEENLQKMDGSKFLEKVESLFECLERQVADNSAGEYTVDMFKRELRRRVLSAEATSVIEPEPEKTQIKVTEITFVPAREMSPYTSLEAWQITLRKGQSVEWIICPTRREAWTFLRAVRATASLGFSVGEFPSFSCAGA